MPTNKHATIRYNTLDRCFSNFHRKYFVEDLIEACNNALFDFAGITDGVKRRQLFDDITFMRSEQGWSVPLEKHKEGRRIYYRYENPNFSINQKELNRSEAEQLKETISILTRFKGLPQFDWMEDLLIKLGTTLDLSGQYGTAVGFDQNPYLKGLDFFPVLFGAIQNKQTLSIKYQGFRQSHPIQMLVHPYFLKQYNNRWFLFGLNDDYNSISNLALDRIQEIEQINAAFIPSAYDFEEYFEDVIGVTVEEKLKPTPIKLKIYNSIWPYIDSKPIHGSQKVLEKHADYVIIEIIVQKNYELTSSLFSFQDQVEVIEPEEYRDQMKKMAERILNSYT